MDPLSSLALKHGTDKYGHHYYTPVYHSYLSHLQQEQVILIEIGIGGYHYTDRGGASLKMWEEYFINGRINGIDIYDKTFVNSDRIKTFRGSQADEGFLSSVIAATGAPDIIIDDGSHVNPLTIKSFEILFPLLKSGGIYIVEDIESSWAEGWAAGCKYYRDYTFPSAINYFRQLTNDINAQYIPQFTQMNNTVDSIHFHKNIIIIKKLP